MSYRYDSGVLICNECESIISLEEDDRAKMESHQLYHHPSEENKAQALVQLYLHSVAIAKAFKAEDYISASMLSMEASNLALRLRRYADYKLEN